MDECRDRGGGGEERERREREKEGEEGMVAVGRRRKAKM